MKLPKKIKILSVPYIVAHHADIIDVDPSGEHRFHGYISDLERQIDLYVSGNHPADLTTFFHEIIHGYEFALNLDIDEHAIDMLASNLVDFFIQNKAWQWFEKQEKK